MPVEHGRSKRRPKPVVVTLRSNRALVKRRPNTAAVKRRSKRPRSGGGQRHGGPRAVAASRLLVKMGGKIEWSKWAAVRDGGPRAVAAFRLVVKMGG